jgi:hypothetical protein
MTIKLISPDESGRKYFEAYGRLPGNKNPIRRSTGTTKLREAEAWLRQALKPGGELFELSQGPATGRVLPRRPRITRAPRAST